MASKRTVNLDALIPREDLEAKEPIQATGGIPLTELQVGKHYYSMLRKPHFQRETDDWDIENVVGLIKSFLDGHLIPAVILWGVKGYNFVIDGAHRLGALIAWANDDYGDGHISRRYFDNQIPKRQKEIADACRIRIGKEIGTFESVSKLALIPNRSEQELKWSSNFGRALETQWVIGDANIAATSFLAINQRAVQIDKTERYMIEHRSEPNVIAARALIKSARGHAYWGGFKGENVEVIEKEAKLIFNAVFEPEDATPEKSTELQPAGQAHTANGLRLALDLVNLINGVKSNTKLEEDVDGKKTVRFIEKTHGVVKYIGGKDHASLSLHPAVYFWGSTGNHRPAIFLAMIALVQEMIEKDELIKFTLNRAKFEEYLVNSSDTVKAILGAMGGWKKSVAPIKNTLRLILNGCIQGKDTNQIDEDVKKAQTAATQADLEELFVLQKRDWKTTKAVLRIRASLERATRCAICKARLVIDDASDDHKERRIDGGSSNSENAQLTHQFCNHGFKEHYLQRALPLPEIPTPI